MTSYMIYFECVLTVPSGTVSIWRILEYFNATLTASAFLPRFLLQNSKVLKRPGGQLNLQTNNVLISITRQLKNK